jgi:hypothetical protein
MSDTSKLGEEEKAALLRGGFDLTEHQVLAASQIGPLFVRIWSNGALSLRLGQGPEYRLPSDDRQKLVDWLALCTCGAFDGRPHLPKAGCT